MATPQYVYSLDNDVTWQIGFGTIPQNFATTDAVSPSVAAVGAIVRALGLPTKSFTTSGAAGSTISAILGVPPGATAVFTPTNPADAGKVAVSGMGASSNLVVGLTASSAGSIPGTISAAGAASITVTLTVSAGLAGVNGIITHGDSLTAHQIPSAVCWPVQLQRQTTKPVRNPAKSGYRVDQLITLYSSDVAPLYNSATFNTLVFLGGTNDLIQGADAATIQSRLTTYWQNAKTTGFKLVACTIPALGNVAAGIETIRQNVNTWIRANALTYADKLADLAANSKLSNPNDTTYYQSDKLHYTTAGSTAELEVIFPLLGLPVEMGTLSANLIPDGDFASGAGGWSLGAGWSVASGKATKVAGSAGNLQRVITSQPIGTRLLLQYDILDYPGTYSGIIYPVIGGHNENSKAVNGTYTECFILTSAAALVAFFASSDGVYSIDNVSLYAIT